MLRRYGYNILAIIVLFVGVLSGCKGQMESDRVSFPVTLGVDIAEGGYEIKAFAQMATLSTQSESMSHGKREYNVYIGYGDSLANAMQDIIDHSNQNISWKHISVIIFSEKLAKRGIEKEVEALARVREIRMNSYMILTNENISKLLEYLPKVDLSIESPFRSINLVSKQSTYTKAVTQKDFLMAYLSKGKTAVLPIVTLGREGKGSGIDFTGLGVIEQSKMINSIGLDDTKNIRWIEGVDKLGTVFVPVQINENKYEITISSISTEPYVIVKMKNNKPDISLEIKVEYGVAQINIPEKFDVKLVAQINEQVGLFIKESLEGTIKKMQKEVGCDIFGFGEKVYRKFPDYWYKNRDNWKSIFSQLDIDVKVTANLRDTEQLNDGIAYARTRE